MWCIICCQERKFFWLLGHPSASQGWPKETLTLVSIHAAEEEFEGDGIWECLPPGASIALSSCHCHSWDSSPMGDSINLHPSISSWSSSVNDTPSFFSSLLPFSMTPDIGKSFDGLVRSMISLIGDESKEELLTGRGPHFVGKFWSVVPGNPVTNWIKRWIPIKYLGQEGKELMILLLKQEMLTNGQKGLDLSTLCTVSWYCHLALILP